MRKKLCCLALVLFALLSLSACGGPSPASEAQLREDLEHSEVFRNWGGDMERTVSNVEIKQRKTDAENKTDVVWIKASTKSEVEAGTMHFIMTYSLYNEGWLLDKVEADSLDEWLFTPLAGPSKERIDALLPKGAVRNTEEFHLDEGVYRLDYNRPEPHKYCDVSTTECLYLEFDFKGGAGWVPRTEEGGKSESWHLDGTYQLVYCQTGEIAGYIELGPMSGPVLQVTRDDGSTLTKDIAFVDGMTETEFLLSNNSQFYADYYWDGIRNARIINGDWSEIRRVAGSLFIGQDHIYKDVYRSAKFPQESLSEYAFYYELIPVSEEVLVGQG